MILYTGCYSRMEIEAFKPPVDSVLICIRDPETEYPKVGYSAGTLAWRHVSHFDFWDVGNENSSHNHGYPAAPEKDLIRLKEVLDWFPKHNIFASCEAGISRSAAVREYLIRRGWTLYTQAQKDRQVHPNAYILAELERLDRADTKLS